MAADLPPNLAGSPPYSEVRMAEKVLKEAEAKRKRDEEDRKRAIEADIRIKNQQTQQR
ncbi:hypothetical protein ABRP18_018670 (plasmid) [Microbacterium sp. WHRI 7836]|uniref:hypothetical protein n=1 Tax=Microbacterium sp. WHRI 7836 TaxID=3162563 RepID=UPI0032EC9ECF